MTERNWGGGGGGGKRKVEEKVVEMEIDIFHHFNSHCPHNSMKKKTIFLLHFPFENVCQKKKLLQANENRRKKLVYFIHVN